MLSSGSVVERTRDGWQGIRGNRRGDERERERESEKEKEKDRDREAEQKSIWIR